MSARGRWPTALRLIARDRLPLAPGDNLVPYVYLDPAAPPRQLLLQLYVEGAQGAHRVDWGEDLIDLGGASARYMGPLPSRTMRTHGGVDRRHAVWPVRGRPWWGPTSTSLGRLDPTPDTLIVSRE